MIGHVGYTGSDDDRDRLLAFRIWMDRNDAEFGQGCIEHDMVELRGDPPRDFLSEQARYDAVITHNLWGVPGYAADDASNGAACSSLHGESAWRRRFQATRARYIFMFGPHFNAPDIGGFIPGYECFPVGFQSSLNVFILGRRSPVHAVEQTIDCFDMNNARLGALSEFLGNRFLDLSYTKVNSQHLWTVGTMTNLEELRLVGTAISDSDLEHVVQLRALMTLNLDGTGISDDGITHLRKLRHLECLSLNHTGIADEGVLQLREFRGLKWLSLIDTGVSDRGIRYLRESTGLEWLSLVKSRVTASGVEELRKALPQCAVRSDFD